MKCCINYVVVGKRDISLLNTSIKSIRKYCDYDINIFFDQEAESDDLRKTEEYKNINFFRFDRLKYPTREENRNSSLFRLVSLRETSKNYDISLYLDNDIAVVNKGFLEGFKISEHFGFCMVQNPRTFITTYEKDMGDIDIGWDVLPYDHAYLRDMPRYMASYNMGVMFFNKNHDSSLFLEEIINEQIKNPSRGQAGLYRTMWKCKFSPYNLPVNWLVCKKDVGIKRPLSLHLGHDPVLEWWKKEFENKEI